MSIIRSKRKRHNFSIIDNTGLIDSNLTWKATGLLAFLMTKPDDWEISIKYLSNNKKDGRDSTIKAIEELVNAGYVYRLDKRKKGRFDTEYLIFETPEDLKEWIESDKGIEEIAQCCPNWGNRNGKTVTEKPLWGNRNGKTVTEKPDQVNTNRVNTDQQITEEVNPPIYPQEEEGEKKDFDKVLENNPDTSSNETPSPLPDNQAPVNGQTDQPSLGSKVPGAFKKHEQSNNQMMQDPSYASRRKIHPEKKTEMSCASDPWMNSTDKPNEEFALWVFKSRWQGKPGGSLSNAKAEIRNNYVRAQDLWDDYQEELKKNQRTQQAIAEAQQRHEALPDEPIRKARKAAKK